MPKDVEAARAVAKLDAGAKSAWLFAPEKDPISEYELAETLGRGSFAVVKKCRRIKTQQSFAAKIIDKKLVRAPIDVEREASISQRVVHPNIVCTEDVFQYGTDVYMIQELAPEGELFEAVVRRHHYSEYDTSTLMRQLLAAVDYMHSVGVVHRDLKPENLLLFDSRTLHIKITDFGLAYPVGGTPEYLAMGTPGYMAPEMIGQMIYGPLIDEFACGVIMYILLAGKFPFAGKDRATREHNVLFTHPVYEGPLWQNTSDAAKAIVAGMLEKDPRKRTSAHQILQTDWINDIDKVSTKARAHRRDTLQRLRQFQSRQKFRAAAHAVMVINKMVKMFTPENSPGASPLLPPAHPHQLQIPRKESGNPVSKKHVGFVSSTLIQQQKLVVPGGKFVKSPVGSPLAGRKKSPVPLETLLDQGMSDAIAIEV